LDLNLEPNYRYTFRKLQFALPSHKLTALDSRIASLYLLISQKMSTNMIDIDCPVVVSDDSIENLENVAIDQSNADVAVTPEIKSSKSNKKRSPTESSELIIINPSQEAAKALLSSQADAPKEVDATEAKIDEMHLSKQQKLLQEDDPKPATEESTKLDNNNAPEQPTVAVGTASTVDEEAPVGSSTACESS
jgi:hypothetical protein